MNNNICLELMINKNHSGAEFSSTVIDCFRFFLLDFYPYSFPLFIWTSHVLTFPFGRFSIVYWGNGIAAV